MIFYGIICLQLLITLAQQVSCENYYSDEPTYVEDDPDAKLNVSQLIRSKGYPVEEHTVQTVDGFLLGVQRIPSGRNEWLHGEQKKKVVLLQHGLLSCATDWVLNFPHQSLGFILADAGYDVWLGNIRGNTYSRRHINLNPSSEQFWNFSFDEMAQYDLPAMIDYILNVTGQEQIYYVGHSQGTTIPFALLSQSPEYNKKIKLFVALAPVAKLDHMTSPIRFFSPFANDLSLVLKFLGVKDFLPNNIVMKFLSKFLCDTHLKFLCKDVIFLICGTDVSQLNQTRLEVYVDHSPAGASVHSILHYAQIINSKKFQKYDFGRKGNILRYNQTKPPEYHIGNISTKVALFWSENDLLADPTDVHNIEVQLKSLVASSRVKLTKFNHLDFVWAVEAYKYIYNDILALLEKF